VAYFVGATLYVVPLAGFCDLCVCIFHFKRIFLDILAILRRANRLVRETRSVQLQQQQNLAPLHH